MKQKILFVITKSNFGGAQRYVYDLATELPKDAYEVVVAFGGNGVLKEKLEAAGIRTVVIKNFQRDVSIYREYKSFGEIWKLYQTERPDIVHLNSSKAGGIGALCGRIAGIPTLIFTAHGLPFLEQRNILWRAAAFMGSYITMLLAHHTITVSENDRVHAQLPFIKHKITTIHTAVPKIQFLNQKDARAKLCDLKTLEEHAQDIWMVTLAELHPNKNHRAAIDALGNCEKSVREKIFYVLLGDGELRTELELYVQEKQLTKNILFLGSVSDVRTHLRAFDIFLLPSKKEGLPYALLEAGSAQLACVASDVGGISEVIENGKNGLLIDPNDPNTISRAIEKLVVQPTLRTQFGANIRNKVEKSFLLYSMLSATIAIYTNTTPRQ